MIRQKNTFKKHQFLTESNKQVALNILKRIIMEKIIIVGSSVHAKVVIDIIEQGGRYKIAGLLDRYRKKGEQTLGYDVLGKEEDLPLLMKSHAVKSIIVAIGDNFARSQVVTQTMNLCPNLMFVSAIHPKASIARDVSIGDGTVIMAGVTVNPCSKIGSFCILNTNSSLDHDSIMDDFSSLAPGVTAGGLCKVGAYAAVSIGAILIDRVCVGEHAVIGAGSTVLGNIESGKLAYGTPAKVIRERNPGDKYL